MPRRLILLFAFVGALAALGMSWHVHTSADYSPPAPNGPDEIYSLFSLRDDAPNDDALKSAWPTPLELEIRVASSDTLKTRVFTYADKPVPLVRGVITEEGVFELAEFVQGNRGFALAQKSVETVQSGVPFDKKHYSMYQMADPTMFCGFIFKGIATVHKDGRLHLQLDVTHSGPKDYYCHLRDNPPDPSEYGFQVLNATGAFVLDPGDSCFFGGLKRRTIGSVSSRVPLLCELPWIDDWFVQRRDVEIDEELLILATVRLAK
jgi:hypothetical protein